MIRKINRFGEVSYTKNEALVTMPFSRLGTEDIETLEENYRQNIKELGYTDSFIYANHLGEIRDRLQMSFDLEGCVDFHYIHTVKLDDMLPFLYSMVDIAKESVNVLWERNNVVIDLEEKRVKALLFEFEGFRTYKRDDATDGLKEIILLALTKNQSILGKPKRADFIEQTEKVYQFSEDVISCKNVDEILNVINSYQQEMEYEQLKLENEKEERRKKSIFYKIKDQIKKEPKQISPSDTIKAELNNSRKTKTKQKSNKSLMDKITSPIGMISIIGVIGAFFIFFTMFDMDSNALSKEDEEAIKEAEQEKEILDAYRLYISDEDNNKAKAYAMLDGLGYDNLPKEDQETLLNWYIEQEQYTKAIQTKENSVYTIGDKIIAESDDDIESALTILERLEASFPENTAIKFDIASLQGQHQLVIENSNLDEYNDRRAVEVIQAYVLTNQVEELNELMDSFKEETESYESLMNHSDKYLDQYAEKREKNEEAKALEEKNEALNEKKEKEKKKKEKKKIQKEIETNQKELDAVKDRIKEIDENITKLD